MDKKRLIKKFDKQANLYEKMRKRRELGAWRQKLVAAARGRVLEIAVGAGANFPYYGESVEEIIAVDFSPEMLKKAREAAMIHQMKVEFIESDVEALVFPPNSFDTIVSTLSLCGYENPNDVVRNLQKWCKPDGQILLLEHGVSSNRLLAGAQKLLDPLFHRAIGCHQDRDIIQIIQSSGLTITQSDHHLFHSVHLIWTKPFKE